MQLQRRRNVNWICNESLRLGLANSVRNWTSNLKYVQFILFFIDHVYTSESNLWSLQSRWTCDGSIFKWSNLPIQFFLLSSLFRLPHRKLLKDFLKNVVHLKRCLHTNGQYSNKTSRCSQECWLFNFLFSFDMFPCFLLLFLEDNVI